MLQIIYIVQNILNPITSDLHFGDCSEDVIEILTNEITQHGVVIIAGDLTLTSDPEQFERISTFFQHLMNHNVTIISTVGNHDFGGTFAEKLSHVPGSQVVNDKYSRSFDLLKEIFHPVFQQEHVIAYNVEQLDYVVRLEDEIFVSIRSHHRKIPRVKDEKIDWIKNVLDNVDNLEHYRLHLVTHYSLWQDPGDKHIPMDRRRRLEEEVLQGYRFNTIIHGHNHRYTYQNTTTPKLGYRMIRISSPTISNRTREFECGYLRWSPSEVSEPELVQIDLV